MIEPLIRSANIDDAEKVDELRKRVNKIKGNKNPPLDPYGGNYPTTQQEASEIEEYNKNSVFLVAEMDSKIIGIAFCFLMHPDLGDYRLKVIVEESFRLQGVGTKLVSGIIKWGSSESKVRELVCSFHKSHKSAKFLLEKFGFNVKKQGLAYYMQTALYAEVEMSFILKS